MPGTTAYIYRFTPVSSDYVFSLVAQARDWSTPMGVAPRGYLFTHIDADGITASRTLTNAASDLRRVPVRVAPPAGQT